MSTTSFLDELPPDGASAWPSRSAMAGIRRHLATTGDYPTPVGWNYAASTMLRNAYLVTGLDRQARASSGRRLTAEMAGWADAQPNPHDPRHYPSWRGRFAVQEAEAEIWAKDSQ